MEVSSHSLFLLQQLNIQREFGFLCDCTVAIGNVYFKAHRAVLAAFSNYFKMIFIHQSSECIKIQPTDIQPDIFSYLLHIMYTGMGPEQQVDPSRLQEGIKFLHAYRLYRIRGGSVQEAHTAKISNLYGIQISQSAAKDDLCLKEARSRGLDKERAAGRAERPQLTLAVGLEGTSLDRRPPNPRSPFSSGASWDNAATSDLTPRIKEESAETEVSGRPRTVSPVTEGRSLSLSIEGPPVLYCQYCGERCTSHQGLREHLFAHATGSLPFGAPAAVSESGDPEETSEVGGEPEGPERGRASEESPALPERREEEAAAGPEEEEEEGLRRGGALSEEPAAELRGGASPSPAPRKRKMACAVCGRRFAQKTQLREHMYAHTGKRSRYHRYSRFCSRLIQASQHFCESRAELAAEEAGRDAQDNVSSCYSLDSEVSQGSIDTVLVE